MSSQGTVSDARTVAIGKDSGREDLKMNSVTKWMLVAVLIGVNTAANGMHAPPRAVSKEPNESFHRVDDRDSAPGSVGDKKGVDNFNHGRFACGEVVSGYTVTCTTGPTKTTVSAPEIDTSVAVSGALFVIGCLAILQGRKRRFADDPVKR
jgi:hypothetical protein